MRFLFNNSILLVVIVFVSCNSDAEVADAELIGDWRLYQVLSDPGDGSGVFNSVNSDKVLSFNLDGSITSNGLMCSFDIDSNTPSIGTYSEEDMFFTTDACNQPNSEFAFEISGNILTVTYFCIEACAIKYIKI